jgi:hypothetical protein
MKHDSKCFFIIEKFNFSASCENEATKSARWMPWRQLPKKDAYHCDKPRLVVIRRLTRGCPNGETLVVLNYELCSEYIGTGEGTARTETSK